jgi:ribosomal protein S18 acetylase RimI-like enzyme
LDLVLFKSINNKLEQTLMFKKKQLEVKIRRYTPKDEEEVHRINESSLEISFRFYYTIFHKREPELFLVAEYQNKIIGFLLVKGNEDFDDEAGALIYAIAVAPEYRNQGVGAQLLNAIYKVLNEKEIKKLYLHVRVGNTRGIHFYEQLGFTTARRINLFYSWGEDAFRMVKEVD